MGLKNESWRMIPGFPHYVASNHARIKSIDRWVNHNYGGRCLKKGKVMSQYINTDGYLTTGITENGRTRTQGVHRLVALAWKPNPENKPEVNHKDGNKLNCRPSNLEWVTVQENAQHAFRIGLRTAPKMTKSWARKFRQSQYRPVIVTDLTTGKLRTYNAMFLFAQKIGTTQNVISQAVKRRSIVMKRYRVAIIDAGLAIDKETLKQ